MARIESLLSARIFQHPQVHGERIYFISNMSGRLSLYAMPLSGGVPEPLLPPQIALQNPELIGGHLFEVFPDHGKILVMIDKDGDERYQPMLLNINGGFPESISERFVDQRCACTQVDITRGLAYITIESTSEVSYTSVRLNIATGAIDDLYTSAWGGWTAGVNDDHTQALMVDGYTFGDNVMYRWRDGQGVDRLLGVPLEERAEGEQPPLNDLGASYFTPGDRGLLFVTTLFADTRGLGYLPLDGLSDPQEVRIEGVQHSGAGEFVGLEQLNGTRYAASYNIDGASWLYVGSFDEESRSLRLETAVVGQGDLAGGVMEGLFYDERGDRLTFSFSTATSPTQLYVVEQGGAGERRQLTNERVLGLPREHLSAGEDASFSSHDGLRVSARLYMPAEALGYEGPRPVVFYVHGGPQGQERPDFAWFSMPLIQFLTLRGFAVFVPNVRGSTGYGMSYMKRIDRDWGGLDRLDHVHALGLLANDPRIDTKRAAVVGRSYGGYMTLTLATRHPELWSAACDMFGPYDLFTFIDRVPETWKPYFALAVGHPERDHDLLQERSPRTYIDQIKCPLLVIQGQNDPRVVEEESRSVVEHLRERGKHAEYLLFDNEGHDVLKFENRVRCYTAITDFFATYLKP